MARLRSKPLKTMRTGDFKNLSTKVLRLRLQNVNLPITGTHARMLERLRLATNPAPAAIQRRPRGHPQAGRVQKNKPTTSTIRVRIVVCVF